MKRFLFCAALCAALLLPLPCAYGAELQVAAWLYENGAPAPLSGAAFALEPTGQTGTTGEDGTLTFHHLAPGPYTLTQTDGPGLRPTLEQPVVLLLHDDGTCTVAGRTVNAISLFYPSPHRAMLLGALALSTVPMGLRLWWLHRKNACE